MVDDTAAFPSKVTDKLFDAVPRLSTTLSSDITNSTTPIPVASVTSFPTEGFITIDNETIYYDGNTTTLGSTSATRGYAGTAVAHLSGAAVKYSIVASTINRIQAEIEATQTHCGTSGGGAGFVNARYLAGLTSGQYLWSGSTAVDSTLLGGSSEGQLSPSLLGGSTEGQLNAGFLGGSTNAEFQGVLSSGQTDKTRTMDFSAYDAIPATTNGANRAKIAGTNFEYYQLEFDKDTDESVYWIFPTPPQYDGGNVTFEVVSKCASITTGTVVWVMTGGSIEDSSTWDVGLGNTITFDAKTVDGTALDIFTATKAGDPGWVTSKMTILRLYRDTSEDTAAEDVDVVGVNAYWEVT